MLFDLRGKRRRLIQVVYAMLAVLMGGGLIMFGIGGEVSGGLLDAFTNRSGVQSGDLVDEAESIEERLEANPRDASLAADLVRARYTAGNALYEFDESGQQTLTSEAREQFELAADAWDRYLQLSKRKVDPSIAQLAANAYFALAQGAVDGNDARRQASNAAEAQARYAEARPSVGSYSTLAIYEYFGNDFEAGDQAAEQAKRQANQPRVERQVEREMQQYRQEARRFQRELTAYNKAQQAGGGESGAPQLEDPAGSFGGGLLGP